MIAEFCALLLETQLLQLQDQSNQLKLSSVIKSLAQFKFECHKQYLFVLDTWQPCNLRFELL
jgi:hypothetical protein